MPRLPPASCSPSCLICPFPAPIHRMDTPLDSLESVPSASPLCQAITRPSSWACICRLLLFPACARRRVRLPGAEKEPGSSALHQHGPPRCAGSLLHILLVNLCFLSSHRLVRNLFTSFLHSRLIGLIHVAGLVLALALLSNKPRTQVALALLFCL